MGLAEELIAIKMRLTGAVQYQEQMQRSATATGEFGAAAERAGAQAQTGAAGMATMQASAAKGMGAMAKMKSVGEGMKSTGQKLTRAFTVPLAIIGGVGVKMALDFSDSMEQISTQAGASQKEVGRMSEAVLNFARSGASASGPNDLAKGLFSIESAGFRGKRAFEALVKSEELASVGHANLEKTSKAVAAAMATQIKGTKNLNETVGLMNSIVGIGAMRFEDLLSAMGTGLLDKAANLGLSLREIGAALGTLTTTGTPAAAASTRMAMAFNMMAAPTAKAEKAMESLGLQGNTLAISMRKKGLVPTLELLNSKLEKLGGGPAEMAARAKLISEMFGGGRTSGGIIALMRHIDLLKQKQGELAGSAGKFKHALEETKKQPIVQLKTAWAQLQVVLIEVGNALIPWVTKAAKFIVKLAEGFAHLPKPVKTVLIVLGVGLAVLGPVLTMIGTMTLGIYALATAFTALDIASAPVVLIVAGIIALGAVIYLAIRNFDTWGKYVLAVISPLTLLAVVIVKNWKNIKKWIVNAIHNTINAIKSFPGMVWGIIKKIPKALGWLVGFWLTLPFRIGAALVNLRSAIGEKIGDVVSFMFTVPGKLINAVSSFAPKAFQFGIKAITFLWNGMKSVWESIKGWFSALPGRLWSALKTGITKLYEAGKELGKEFLSGFLDALPGPVKDALNLAGEGLSAAGNIVNPNTTVQPHLEPIHPGHKGGGGGHKSQKPGASSRAVHPQGHRRTLSTLGEPASASRRQGSGNARGTPLRVVVPVHLGHRQLGEAVADVTLEDEANG